MNNIQHSMLAYTKDRVINFTTSGHMNKYNYLDVNEQYCENKNCKIIIRNSYPVTNI